MAKTPEQIVNHILSGNKKLNIDKWSKAKLGSCDYCSSPAIDHIRGHNFCTEHLKELKELDYNDRRWRQRKKY